MAWRWLAHNEVTTLLTQGRSFRTLVEGRANGNGPDTPPTPAAEAHFEKWKLPPLGFRNYWYPVMRSQDVSRKPVFRRLLGEDIVFWRDGGKVNAIDNRCPHRGSSLANGHIRFPGSGTISCPYHGWTFDGTGALRACIQEGPDSAMVGKVKTKAYPVEERLGIVWAWIGDMDPVPLEEDIPVAMNVPGAAHYVHFLPIWRTNWAPALDNFIDNLHAPYLHRAAPQFLMHRLTFKTIGADPAFNPVQHGSKTLEVPITTRWTGVGGVNRAVRPAQVEFPGLGTFPRHNWWRVLPPRKRPDQNYVPGYSAQSFIHGLPGYVHTVHEDNYFTAVCVPIDRDHCYLMTALSGRQTWLSALRWKFFFPIFKFTHNTLFLGQDHRVLRYTKLGLERLSAWDQDIIAWRKFAVKNARGYQQTGDSPEGTGQREEELVGSGA